MMERNSTIVKLGFECNDAHWRNLIDRALLRNNDYWRRQHQNLLELESLPPAEERTLSHLTLRCPPLDQVPTDVFPDGSSPHNALRGYVAQNWKLPTTSQLQNYAKNLDINLAYNVAAPLIKECRSWMLDTSSGTEVVVMDAFGVWAHGSLRTWSENNDNWSIDVWIAEGRRCDFKSNKEPAFAVSEAWVQWMRS